MNRVKEVRIDIQREGHVTLMTFALKKEDHLSITSEKINLDVFEKCTRGKTEIVARSDIKNGPTYWYDVIRVFINRKTLYVKLGTNLGKEML